MNDSSMCKRCLVLLLVLFVCFGCAREINAQPSQTPNAQALKIQADTLTVQADSLFEAGNKLTEAIELYKQALRTYRELKLRENEGYVLQNMGRSYEKLGRWEEFAATFEELYSLFRPEDVDLKIRFKEELCPKYYQRLNSPPRALKCFTEAESLLRQAGDERGRASVLTLIAMMQYLLGEAAEMKKAFISAAEIYKARKEHFDEADVYLQFGSLSNNPNDAPFYLQQSLNWWRRFRVISDKAHAKEGETLEAFGSFYRAFNDRLSLSYFEQAFEVWQKIGNLQKQAAVLSDIAMMAAASGNIGKAMHSYNAVRKIRQSQNDTAGEADVVTRMGWTNLFGNKLQEAVLNFNEAAALWLKAGRPIDSAAASSEATVALAQLRRKPESLAALAKVKQQYEGLDSKQLSQGPLRERIAGNIALAYFFNENYEQALTYWKQQLERSRTSGDIRSQASILFLTGWSYERLGKDHDALRYYRESIALRERIRDDIVIDSLRSDAFVTAIGVYQRAILVLMKQGRAEEAFELSEHARARTLLDQISNLRIEAKAGGKEDLVKEERRLLEEIQTKERELRAERVKGTNEINLEMRAALEETLEELRVRHNALLNNLQATQAAEYVSLRKINTLTLSAVKRELKDDQTTLLSYFVTPEKLFVFIIRKDSFQAVDLCPTAQQCVNKEKIDKQVNASVGFRNFGNLRQGHPQSLKTLYDWLIRPIRAELKTAKLAIIPNGALNYVPFAALSDGEKYLVEDFTLYELPNASILPVLVQKLKPSKNTVFAIANTTAANLPPLRMAGDTAKYIASLYGSAAKLDKDATESAFTNEAGQAETVFVSAHGIYDGRNPLFSNMTLAPDGGRNDGILNVHEIYNLKLAETNLVVLSGCETQRGQLSSGDDIIALNRAFIYAGAPSVVASLWSVDEPPTQVLMKRFFDYLTNKKVVRSRAEALRLAQLDTMKQYPNPYYWSAFVLTGIP